MVEIDAVLIERLIERTVDDLDAIFVDDACLTIDDFTSAVFPSRGGYHRPPLQQTHIIPILQT